MASLIIDTGNASHPQISIDQVDLQRGTIEFHWIGGPYSGACSEQFPITLDDHGELTLNQMVTQITASMVAKLP